MGLGQQKQARARQVKLNVYQHTMAHSMATSPQYAVPCTGTSNGCHPDVDVSSQLTSSLPARPCLPKPRKLNEAGYEIEPAHMPTYLRVSRAVNRVGRTADACHQLRA
jgi:hypothetical protein